MIATLKYHLPSEEEPFKAAITGYDLYLAVGKFEERLRQYDKYGTNFETVEESIQKILDEFYRIMDDYRIDLETLS